MADLNPIKKEFMDIYASLSTVDEDTVLRGGQEQLYACFRRLDQLAAMEVADGEAEILRSDPELSPAMAHISRKKRINGLGLELARAKTVLASPSPWEEIEGFVYYPNYLELARMEFDGAGLSSGERVVFLGSGPLPLTLICLCTRYRIQGTGIEQSGEYAELSRRLIRSLGLAEQIQIVEGNHFSLPLEPSSQLIMIGADALPKAEIFSHLAAHLEPGSRLSYRIYEKGLRRLLDVQSRFGLPPGFKEYLRIRPTPPVNNTSVFVVKTD